MQRAIMAKHVERGDCIHVNGHRALVTKVDQHPRRHEVVLWLDLDFEIVRGYDETVYRYEVENVAKPRSKARMAQRGFRP